MGNYALAKQMLFKRLKDNGKAIVNYDDKYNEYFLLSENNNITYGFDGGNYKVINYDMNQGGTKFIYSYNNNDYKVITPLLGKYNIYNTLLIISVLNQMGFELSDINNIMLKLKSPAGRMDMIKYGDSVIVIDYAHTPDAVEKIIKTVSEVTKGNIYTVFGCTGDRDRTKRPIMMNIVTSLSKFVIVTNDDPHNEDPNQIVNDMLEGIEVNNYEVCLDRKQAIIKGINLLNENDSLLILGKGHEEVMIIKDNKRVPFNDKKVVLEYLESITERIN
jgi:UDP-N-acetylmuramoyl-L-alanyl-D-glutamate--2,6-diaminopimelate ligase